jgi:ribose/xylose/arabinose/galactoside ABC-type transport system permease subunit
MSKLEQRAQLQGEEPSTPDRKHRSGSPVARWLRQNGGIVGMVLVLVAFEVMRPIYLSPANLISVATQSTILVVMAVGLMLTMSMRGVDLSVAQVADASGLLAGALIVAGQPLWLAFIAPVGFGLATGVVNAVLMAYLGVPAIIGTLGMMFAVRGGELMFSHGAQPQILFTLPPSITEVFFFLGRGKILGVPASIVLVVVLMGLVVLLMDRSTLGRRMEAVGGNARAAYLAGVNMRATFGWGFVFSGVLAAIAGIILVSRAGIAVPRGAEVYLLDSFVSVFLGTVLSPRSNFTVLGTIGGALFVSLLGNGLTLLGLGASVKYLVYGTAILAAIAVNRLRSV